MGKKIAVLIDSSSGLDQAQAQKHGLAFQSLQIVHGANHVMHDGIDVNSEQLYALIEKGDSLTTSQSALGDNLKIAESLLKTNEQVFCIPVSSGLSGALGTWKALEQEVPDHRLQVLDAKSIATGIVDLADKVKKWVEAGKTVEQIHELVAKNAANTYGLLVCNDFARLVKGGRLGAFKGALATLLRLNVLIEFKSGKLTFKDKSRSVDKLVQKFKDTIYEALQVSKDEEVEALSFLHTFPEKNRKEMEAVLAQVKKTFPAQTEWRVEQLPAVVACHVGLKSFAVLAVKKSD